MNTVIDYRIINTRTNQWVYHTDSYELAQEKLALIRMKFDEENYELQAMTIVNVEGETK